MTTSEKIQDRINTFRNSINRLNNSELAVFDYVLFRSKSEQIRNYRSRMGELRLVAVWLEMDKEGK
jgi:hypothetical protein